MNASDGRAGQDPERDPVLDRVYAARSRDEPPVSLDDAIRAAVRREVRAKPRAFQAALGGWRVPISIAAILIVSVTVVMLMREERGELPQVAPREENASGALHQQTVRPALRDSAEESRPQQPENRAPKPLPEGQRTTPASPGAQSALPSQSAALERMKDSGAASGSGALEAAPSAPKASPGAAPVPGEASGMRPDFKPSAASRPPLREAESPRDQPATSVAGSPWSGLDAEPPEKWLERIEQLRRAGRTADAEEMLAEYRRRFPSRPLPPAGGR